MTISAITHRFGYSHLFSLNTFPKIFLKSMALYLILTKCLKNFHLEMSLFHQNLSLAKVFWNILSTVFLFLPISNTKPIHCYKSLSVEMIKSYTHKRCLKLTRNKTIFKNFELCWHSLFCWQWNVFEIFEFSVWPCCSDNFYGLL